MILRFDRFRFDPANLRVADPSGPVRLTPKAFEVLRVLLERRGNLVRKDELLDEVWPDTHVTDGVLKVCVTEIRRALGDSASEPRFLETVHRRGYRFIANVTLDVPKNGAATVVHAPEPAGAAAGSANAGSSGVLVGRQSELERLERHLSRALDGERQVVFVTGDPGVGKTALVEHFVAAACARERLAVASGQSLEQFGATEAYLPVLDAIGRLARETDAACSLLRRYAPTWLVQLPWLLEAADAERVARERLGGSRNRMLREMRAFLAAFSAEIPLVLVLEDIHWSDPSTVDLLSAVASRGEPSRLLVLATFRPVQLILSHHPLRAVSQTLVAKRQATEIGVDHLDERGVDEYLRARFPGARFPAGAPKLLHERTDGKPLFLVTLIESLLARGAIVERDGKWGIARGLADELADTPETLRLLIHQQLERLEPDDVKLLEAASLAGMEFSAAAAAAGAGCRTVEAEERCERLALCTPFLRGTGAAEWPDGTVAGRYTFRHALYRETLLKGVPSRRRADAQLRIARKLEAAHGSCSNAIAAELAVHFEEGGDRARAVAYRRMAAETATSRHALLEAERHMAVAVTLLGGLPWSEERDRTERSLQSELGAVRLATRGYAAPEVVQAYARAVELSSGTPDEPSAFPVLWGLWSFHTGRAELDRALDLAQRNMEIATENGERLLQLFAHLGLWTTCFFRGDFTGALRHLDAGEPLYDALEDRRAALAYGQDPKIAALAQRAILCWHLGAGGRGVELSLRAVDEARALGHPMSLAFAMSFAAWLRILRREPELCLEQAEAVIAFAGDQGLPHWVAGSLHSRGWARAELGDLRRGIVDMEHGLALLDEIGGRLGRGPRSLDLAVAKMRAGRLARARELVEEANTLIVSTGERYHEPELYRADAELSIAEAGGVDAAPAAALEGAERLLRAAVELAHERGAPALELRSATALARVCRGAALAPALARVRALLARVDGGAGTRDLLEARELAERSAP